MYGYDNSSSRFEAEIGKPSNNKNILKMSTTYSTAVKVDT